MRHDTSNVIASGTDALKSYTDASVDALREENRIQHLELGDSLKEYADASVTRLRNEMNNKLATLDASVNTHFDSLLTEARNYTDNLVDTTADNLRGYSDDNDASLKEFLETELAQTRDGLEEDYNEKIGQLQQKSEADDRAVDASLKAYTDSLIETVRHEFTDGDESMRIELEGRISDEVSTLNNRITDELNAYDTSLTGYTDASVPCFVHGLRRCGNDASEDEDRGDRGALRG